MELFGTISKKSFESALHEAEEIRNGKQWLMFMRQDALYLRTPSGESWQRFGNTDAAREKMEALIKELN